MRTGKNRACPICGKIIKPGGMGGHMRLAHNKTYVKVVKKEIRDVRDVPDVPELDLNDVRGDISDVRNVSETMRKGGEVGEAREIRPSDYIKKKERVIRTDERPAFNVCADCGGFFPTLTHWTYAVDKERNETIKIFICDDCWQKRWAIYHDGCPEKASK